MIHINVNTTESVVYGHYINGNLFYIGSGTHGRAFSALSRNPIWLALVVQNNNCYEVEILHICTSIKDARDIEGNLIKELNPIANIVLRAKDLDSHESFFSEKSLEIHRRIKNIGGYSDFLNIVEYISGEKQFKSFLITQVILGKLDSEYTDALDFIESNKIKIRSDYELVKTKRWA